jgi:hypothetical protein
MILILKINIFHREKIKVKISDNLILIKINKSHRLIIEIFKPIKDIIIINKI